METSILYNPSPFFTTSCFCISQNTISHLVPMTFDRLHRMVQHSQRFHIPPGIRTTSGRSRQHGTKCTLGWNILRVPMLPSASPVATSLARTYMLRKASPVVDFPTGRRLKGRRGSSQSSVMQTTMSTRWLPGRH